MTIISSTNNYKQVVYYGFLVFSTSDSVNISGSVLVLTPKWPHHPYGHHSISASPTEVRHGSDPRQYSPCSVLQRPKLTGLPCKTLALVTDDHLGEGSTVVS